MNTKTILLSLPPHHQVYKLLEENLIYHGFKVINIVREEELFRYPSVKVRLQTKFRQIILRDKLAKLRVKTTLVKERISRQITESGGIDYALFIRGDIYPPEFLQFIREASSAVMVNYQWDGIKRFPEIWKCIPQFDRFFVFDPADLHTPGHHFLPATNFYFDHDISEMPPEEYDFYFTGSHQQARAKSIIAFARHAEKMGWNINFKVFWWPTQKITDARAIYTPKNIRIGLKGGTFQENLYHTKRARVLVDVLDPVHNGLSFRAFEALGYRKKLITTNAETAKYDFYHPDNIFIWDGETFDGIDDFLKRPYHEIAPEIREKYSFGNWIRYVLDIPPYQPITLPEVG
ncbi:hypothetical protein [Neisseria dentiae]|uniref:hypothetical protein n=1 Tax=Neisseria dentiae TaxID=194197 RepID=UPI00359F4F68